MTKYDHIALIYNPNSTGDAPSMAKSIRRQLSTIGHEAELTPTQHAGHAEELAYGLSVKYRRPLIISVSGDGGYHEVVNGVMRAKNEDDSRHPVVTVAGAGNANDHRRVVRQKPLTHIIDSHQPISIDLLKFTATSASRRIERYAHSYIGFGITPEVAVELNRHSLNPIKELTIALKAFLRYKPFTIEQNGKRRQIDSLIFANINEMAKVIKLSESNNMQDNKFEVVEFPHSGRMKLLTYLIKASVFGMRNQPSYNRYEFRTIAKHTIQSDGEVEFLNERAQIRVESVPKAIDSLL